MTQDVQHSEGPAQRGSQALTEALQLQVAARERAAAPARKHGKRRKGDVVDLENRELIRSRGRKLFLTFLIVEAVIAVIAVITLVAVLVSSDAFTAQ